MIKTEILPINLESLTEHSKIPISFEVNKTLEISRVDSGLGGINFNEITVHYKLDFQLTKRNFWGEILSSAY